MPKLQYLDLSSNTIYGTLHAGMGQAHPDLSTVLMNNNQLSAILPAGTISILLADMCLDLASNFSLLLKMSHLRCLLSMHHI